MNGMRTWGLAALVCFTACGNKESATDKKVIGAGVTGAGEGKPEAKSAAPPAAADEDKAKDKDKGKGKRAAKASKEQQKAYNDALKRGRKAAHAKDWAGAGKAFEECLTLAPDDAMALSELGWALYSAGDLAKAEEVTRHAVALANEPRFKGADLYNLGMIQLARKDNAAAIVAFKDSLRARPNTTVRAALAKLDPEAAKEFELFAPTWLKASGSPEEECKKAAAAAAEAEAAPQAEGEDADWSEEICTCAEPAVAGKLAKPEGSWKAVQLVAYSCHFKGTEMGETIWDLHVQTKDGWFRREGIASAPDTGRTTGEILMSGLVLQPGPGGAQILVLTTSVTTDYMGGGIEETSEVENLIVAGIGASGKPSATPSIEVSHNTEETNYQEEEEKSSVTLDAEFQWVVTPAGEVKLEPKATKGVDGKVLNEMVGTHPVVFP